MCGCERLVGVKEIAGRKFYSCEDVAKKTGFCIATVRKWCKKGIVKAKKVGRSWFIDIYDYDRIENIFV
ncbi:MAG: helix-turn-helix domain-containing protein [Promethearchaeota archaeon]